MGVIGIILLVVFVIVSVLLVVVVLVQNEDGDSMGGLFGGSSSTTFGSQSGNVLTRTTYVLVTLFFLTSFGLAFINKTPTVKSLDAAVQQTQEAEGTAEYWQNNDTAPSAIKSAAEDSE